MLARPMACLILELGKSNLICSIDGAGSAGSALANWLNNDPNNTAPLLNVGPKDNNLCDRDLTAFFKTPTTQKYNRG